MLVENAVKHNIISSKNKLDILIGEEDQYIFVRNNINPKLNVEPSTGIGLNNIRERLQHIAKEEMKIVQDSDYFTVFLPKIFELI